MEMMKAMAPLTLTISVFLVIIASASQPVAAVYTNHTVGGPSGWFFSTATNTTSTNFSSWAANQTFNLGDFLIFKTSTNQSVIQTYNETTYRSCTIDDSEDDDTFVYTTGNSQFEKPLTVVIPLTIEGPNYYFSDFDDGIQCLQGMAFEIDVKHGSGLPPNLNQPPPPPYVEPPSSGEDSPSPPVTINKPAPNDSGVSGGAHVHWVVLHVLVCGVTLVLR